MGQRRAGPPARGWSTPTWRRSYLEAKSKALERSLAAPKSIDLALVWDGDGRNPNAALTVFRHFDSASVVKGMVGEPPKTAWVIGYPLLERIYYLLVAGYDVYGNAGHQLNSRALHGLPAHGRRVQLPRVPAAGGARADARLLVPRRVGARSRTTCTAARRT